MSLKLFDVELTDLGESPLLLYGVVRPLQSVPIPDLNVSTRVANEAFLQNGIRLFELLPEWIARWVEERVVDAGGEVTLRERGERLIGIRPEDPDRGDQTPLTLLRDEHRILTRGADRSIDAYDDSIEAAQAFQQRVADYQARGWVFRDELWETTSLTSAVNEEMEQALLEEATPEAYLVYADWLEQQGDPRSQWISLSTRAEQAEGRERSRLRAEARRVRSEHRTHIEGPLRGLSHICSADWKNGFIHAIEIQQDEADRALAAHAWHVLTHLPAGRLLREARCRDQHSAWFVEMLCNRGVPESLHSLVLGRHNFFGRRDAPWPGDLTRLWPLLPNLRKLSVTALSPPTDSLPSQRLQALRFTGAVSRRALTDLNKLEWPRLKRLELWLQTSARSDVPRTPAARVDYEVLLNPDRLPHVDVVALCGEAAHPDAVDAMASTGLLDRLRTLMIDRGDQEEAALRRLLARAEQCTNLEVVGSHRFGLPGESTLAQTIGTQLGCQWLPGLLQW